MRDFARRHPVLVYVVLSYALSWAYWIPLARSGAVVTPGGSASHFPGLLGPAVAAFLTTALLSGRAGMRTLAARSWLVSRPPSRFWGYALSPVAFLALALLIAGMLDRRPPWSDFTLFSGLPPLPLAAVLLLVLLFNGYGEEIGWRGFLLTRLLPRYGTVRSALLVAAVWAGWHAPTFWTIEGYRSMSIPILLGGFGLGLCAGSIVLAHIATRTQGSILGAAVWHLAYNMSAATTAGRGIVGAVTTACVEAWAVIIVIQEVRGLRAGRRHQLGDAAR
ncbi:MAG TPA: CPBP family intramembrane glutamic endopeptidase [Gemmatimonadaceae bacterium]|nr:CPBP family intramembrane glutamic endopeptidase [Gemmatimonadaceae bacterium]